MRSAVIRLTGIPYSLAAGFRISNQHGALLAGWVLLGSHQTLIYVKFDRRLAWVEARLLPSW
jgi:hypothetical protein